MKKPRIIKRRPDPTFPCRRRVNGKRVPRSRKPPRRTISRRSPKISRRDRSFITKKRKLFYEVLKQRLPISRACQLAGITYSTYRNWMIRGKDPKNPVHQSFRAKVRQIEAGNEREALDIIRAVAKGGGKIVETKVVHGKMGGTERTRVVKQAHPQWTAAAWYLERTMKDSYGKDAVQADKVKSADEIAKEVKDAVDALKQSVPDRKEIETALPKDMPE